MSCCDSLMLVVAASSACTLARSLAWSVCPTLSGGTTFRPMRVTTSARIAPTGSGATSGRAGGRPSAIWPLAHTIDHTRAAGLELVYQSATYAHRRSLYTCAIAAAGPATCNERSCTGAKPR